jgi:GNAT superfamily N-acetyltransferase
MTVDFDALVKLAKPEPLDRKKHDRAAFTCGDERLDRYLKEKAASLADTDQVKVYVVCEAGSTAIVGYFGICAHAVQLSELPDEIKSKLAKYREVSAILLSMMAVATPHQDKGIGTYLLTEVLMLALKISDQLGARFLVLDALTERAKRLYAKFGFIELPGIPNRMIFDLNTARKAIGKAAVPATPLKSP